MNFKNRTEANAFYAEQMRLAELSGPKALDAVMAEMGLNDLWFLLTVLLNRHDMNNRSEINPDWLFLRVQEVNNDPDGKLDLWAREHYKSTVITFGLTIKDLLNDPEKTFGLFSVTRGLAQDFLKQIKEELEKNETLKRLYPDVLYENPEKESPSWGLDKGIRVKRKGNCKEESVSAWGLMSGMPTSKHFTDLLYDDVVTEESVTNYDQLTKTIFKLKLSFSLGSHGGRRRMIGTRYHLSDAWGSVAKEGIAEERRHAATVDGKPGSKSTFLRQDLLDKKRRDQGPYIFACQMLLDPKADEAQGFDENWLNYWTPAYEHWSKMNLYLLVDPSSGKKKKRSNNDYTSMWVIGLGADKRYYLVDGLRDRINLTSRADAVISFHRKYNIVKCGYESIGLQADIEHIEFQQELVNFHFVITELGGRGDKGDHIKKLIPICEQGRLFLPGVLPFHTSQGAHIDLVKQFKEEEYVPYPSVVFDDMLDNMANILHPDLAADFPDTDEYMMLRGGVENMPAGNKSVGFDYNPLG